jgi:hypothetical protein
VWGTDRQAHGDPLDFLDSDSSVVTGSTSVTTAGDDQTLATALTSASAPLRPDGGLEGQQKSKKKNKEGRSVQFEDDVLSVGGLSLGSAATFEEVNGLGSEAGAGAGAGVVVRGGERGKQGLLGWLFRNRDKL